jgi:ABC-type antimicrobial peptide transport system permease subunit
MKQLRQVLRHEYPSLPILSLERVSSLIDRQLTVEQIVAMLSAYFGCLAVLLAMIGVYGVLSHQVVEQTREIAIRAALGATKHEVLWSVVHSTGGFVVIGIVLGVGVASGLSRFVRSLLFGVPNADLITYATVAILLFGIALIAIYLPAHRATRVDPMQALRYE